MTEGTKKIMGFKKFLYRKKMDIKPSATYEAVSQGPGRIQVVVKPSDPKIIRFVEVTMRDGNHRDYLYKMSRKRTEFRTTFKNMESGDFIFSIYLMAKNGNYSRVEKKLSEIFIPDPPPEAATTGTRIKDSNSNDPVPSSGTQATGKTIRNLPPPVKRSWPNSSTYAQALQSLSFSINQKNKDIRESTFLKNENVKYSTLIQGAGNFGVVFKFSYKNTFHALKCFTRGGNYLELRYSEIGKMMKSLNLPFFIKLNFYDNLIRTVNKPSEYFPAVTMEWVDGVTLYNYINQNYKNQESMRNIAKSILNAVKTMQENGIAHGDLSGDNILIGEGDKVTVIDYDGMYVPYLKEVGPEELGHEAFQHPSRGRYYGSKLDNFSALVIYISLLALASKPQLWKFNEGDPDKMLFDPADFHNPGSSKIFKELEKIGGKTAKLSALLIEYVDKKVDWDGIDLGKLTRMK